MKYMSNYLSTNRLLACLPLLTLAMMVMLIIPSATAQDDGSYDPSIHVYRYGMAEINTADVRAGSLNNLQPGGGVVQPNAVEAGSYRFVRGNQSIDLSPSAIRYNACGEDHYSDYYYVSETVVDNAGTSPMYAWVSGVTSSTWAQIRRLGYLDGGYYCVGGSCTISICSTSEFGNNPNSVRLSYN